MKHPEFDDFYDLVVNAVRTPNFPGCDTGLIIVEPSAGMDPIEVLPWFPAGEPIAHLNYLPGDDEDLVIRDMVRAFESGAHVVLELGAELPEGLYQQLRRIGDSGQIDAFNLLGEERLVFQLPAGRKLFLVASRDAIESIRYEHFYSGIGAVLSCEGVAA